MVFEQNPKQHYDNTGTSDANIRVAQSLTPHVAPVARLSQRSGFLYTIGESVNRNFWNSSI